MFYRVIEELFAFLHISITISALIVGFVLSAQPFSRLIFQPYITSYNHIESKIDIYIDRGKGKKAIFIISTPGKTPDAYCHNDNTIKHAKTMLHDHQHTNRHVDTTARKCYTSQQNTHTNRKDNP